MFRKSNSAVCEDKFEYINEMIKIYHKGLKNLIYI